MLPPGRGQKRQENYTTWAYMTSHQSPRVLWACHKPTNWQELNQRNHFLPLSWTSRQSGPMNLGYLPTSLRFRGLSLPEVSISRSGVCPPPFSFSFLLKLSACDFHGRTKIPEQQFCPRMVPALLLSPKRAPLLPRETEKEQVLSGIWISGSSEL